MKPVKQPPSLYIHFPFCLSKCHYCDFFSGIKPQSNLISQYITALIKEINLYPEDEFFSLYIGGGTPSLIPSKEFEKLINVIRERFTFKRESEFTIEVNPEDVTHDLARFWQKMGVNRVSMGVQSMDRKSLKLLNRRNTPESNRMAMIHLRDAGFININVDWILSIRDDHSPAMLDFISAFRPEHVSVYHLTIAEDTYLFDHTLSGQYIPYSDEEYVINYELAIFELAKRGYMHYELSNLALEVNSMSRHNLNYWNLGEYYGFGAGASGFLFSGFDPMKGIRWKNQTDLSKYFALIKKGSRPVEFSDELLTTTLMKEYVMLQLRLREGLEFDQFEKIFEVSISKKTDINMISQLEDLIILENGHLRLTLRGLHVSNQVIPMIWEMLGLDET